MAYVAQDKKEPEKGPKRRARQGQGAMLFTNGDFYNGQWEDDQMHGIGTYYYSFDNYFYSGGFKENEETGRGLYFYPDTQDFYMGEVFKSQYHGKGLFYRKDSDMWELNFYKEGKVQDCLKSGQGKPMSLSISRDEIQAFDGEIYIKPKDYFFDHY